MNKSLFKSRFKVCTHTFPKAGFFVNVIYTKEPMLWLLVERRMSIMDFLSGKIKTLYFKYLASAFGSALITSIYSIVDMAMVGQYHGPEGTAALCVSRMPVVRLFNSDPALVEMASGALPFFGGRICMVFGRRRGSRYAGDLLIIQ